MQKKKKQSTEHFEPTIQLSLVKASWCSACKQYLSSDSFTELQRSIQYPFVFKMYDLDSDASMLLTDLGIQRNEIKFVPTVLITSRQETSMYKSRYTIQQRLWKLSQPLQNKKDCKLSVRDVRNRNILSWYRCRKISRRGWVLRVHTPG